MTDEKKILQAVLNRLLPALSEEDLALMEDIEKRDQKGEMVHYFLLSRFPFFNTLIEEEGRKLIFDKPSDKTL